MLIQAMGNIVANAIKYSGNPSLEIWILAIGDIEEIACKTMDAAYHGNIGTGLLKDSTWSTRSIQENLAVLASVWQL